MLLVTKGTLILFAEPKVHKVPMAWSFFCRSRGPQRHGRWKLQKGQVAMTMVEFQSQVWAGSTELFASLGTRLEIEVEFGL